MAQIAAIEPVDRAVVADQTRLDQVAEAFAKVIDAKSPWTYRHSNGVAGISHALGVRLGLDPASLRELKRAALLHDLGKLAVSNLILDKPGKLTDEELATMRRHPANTLEILNRVGCFQHLAGLAAAHHERLDGRGYHLGLAGDAIMLPSRILCVADICDALRASRPYRDGLPVERVLGIMAKEVDTALDPVCYAALRDVLATDEADGQLAPAVQLVPALGEDYQQAA
jgi:putative nucleotidyltransferase with HDIG domain